MWTAERRLQRREFRDYQPLFMLINSLDFIDAATRRAFVCIHGEAWRRYTALTKRSRERRITALFLSGPGHVFQSMLYVGADCLKGREHRCATLWADPAWPLDEATARHLCIGLGGRSILPLSTLWPAESMGHHGLALDRDLSDGGPDAAPQLAPATAFPSDPRASAPIPFTPELEPAHREAPCP